MSSRGTIPSKTERFRWFSENLGMGKWPKWEQKSRKGRVENWVITENTFLSTENLANLRGIRF
jgi:hypothetical protein